MLAKEVVSAVVPSGDIVFVEAAWDALLRSTYKHVAIRCVCGVRVISLCIWETWCSSFILCFQIPFRKFHLVTGLPAIDSTSDGTL